MAKDLGARIIDLNQSQPYADFVKVPTGPDWFVYENFWFNTLARELGMSTNLLSQVDVVGASIENIETPFKPAWEM